MVVEDDPVLAPQILADKKKAAEAPKEAEKKDPQVEVVVTAEAQDDANVSETDKKLAAYLDADTSKAKKVGSKKGMPKLGSISGKKSKSSKATAPKGKKGKETGNKWLKLPHVVADDESPKKMSVEIKVVDLKPEPTVKLPSAPTSNKSIDAEDDMPLKADNIKVPRVSKVVFTEELAIGRRSRAIKSLLTLNRSVSILGRSSTNELRMSKKSSANLLIPTPGTYSPSRRDSLETRSSKKNERRSLHKSPPRSASRDRDHRKSYMPGIKMSQGEEESRPGSLRYVASQSTSPRSQKGSQHVGASSDALKARRKSGLAHSFEAETEEPDIKPIEETLADDRISENNEIEEAVIVTQPIVLEVPAIFPEIEISEEELALQRVKIDLVIAVNLRNRHDRKICFGPMISLSH
jgi:hypothetical protein